MPRILPSIENRDDSDIRAAQELESWTSRLWGSLRQLRSTGSLATFNQYQSFINPGLKIRGNPIIPLPLNEQTAQTIKDLCQRAPGDDSLTSNVWRFDATQFELTNPAWPQFLQTVASDAEKTYDAGGMLPKVKYLTLYGPGPMPTQDPVEKRSLDIKGTLTIILPSEHQGADINLSVFMSSLCFSPAPSSAWGVSAISWLQDVKCEVNDLISGYRLAITYELCNAERFGVVPNAAEVIGHAMNMTRSILKDWPSHFPGIDKFLYPLADESKECPQTVEETKGRDRAVCQLLDEICPKVGCYFFFARVTHEITEECGSITDVTHTIDGVTTPHGLELPISGTFNAQKEILGFSQYNLEHREPDSDDDDDLPPEMQCEEREYIRRCHDTAVLIAPKEHIMSLIDRKEHVTTYGSTKFYDQTIENLVSMVATEMERSPDDPNTRQVVLDVMTSLSRTGAVLRVSAVERIIELSLVSGDKDLYDKTITVTSFATSSDSTYAAKLLEEHLTKEYLDKGEAVNWNDWLGPLTGRSFQDFRQSCSNLRHGIKSEALYQSFDAWMLDALDLRMETEQTFHPHDCSPALDWIRLRSEKQDWILNRFLPNIAAHASRVYLFNLLSSLRLQSNTPGLLNTTAMCQSIIQNGFEKLVVRIKDFGYIGGTPEPVLPLFVRCIEDCHRGGLTEEASRLLAATSAGLAKSRHSWPRNIGRSRAIMEGLVIPLAGLFERGAAVPVPEFGELVELLIRDFIHTTVPPFPAEPNGWAYDARGCACSDCWELRAFLASPVMQIWEFPAAEKRRKHIQEMLLDDIYSFRFQTIGTRSPYTLVVTKTGGQHQLKVKKWQDAYQQLNNLVVPFRNEAMAGCLGDEKYRELILLEGFAQYAAPAGVAGARRRAPSTVDEPEPQRRRVM